MDELSGEEFLMMIFSSRLLGSLCISIRGCDGGVSGWDASVGKCGEPKRLVDPFARLALRYQTEQTARNAPSLRAAAQCGVCGLSWQMRLLGIVGRATTFVARLASIRIEPCSTIVNTYAKAP